MIDHSAARESLTAREKQVLDLVAEGRTNNQIADALGLRPNTVKIHLSHIFTKLGTRTRKDLIQPAASRIEPDPAAEPLRGQDQDQGPWEL